MGDRLASGRAHPAAGPRVNPLSTRVIHEAFVMQQNEHGVIWNVIGPMSGPSG